MTRRFLFLLLLLPGLAALAADNLLRDDSFEKPVVSARTGKEKGGDPTNDGKGPEWIRLAFHETGKNGKVTAGLTNEQAHTGKQSLFVHFEHVDASYQRAVLTSNLFPVVSGTDYDFSIWGRADAKEAIDPHGRSAYFKVEIDFFAKNGVDSVGDTYYAVQPMPGPKDHEPFYTADAWQNFQRTVTTPADAVFAQVTLTWESGSDAGETNGTMYFDDASFAGPAAANPDMVPEPDVETPPPDTTGTGMTGSAAATPGQ